MVVLIVVFSAVGMVVILGEIDNSSFNSTGASNITGYGIAHEVTSVFGFNNTAKQWYTATLVRTNGTSSTPDKVAATFTFARNATNVGINILLIQTKNSSQDVYNLLQHNALFGTFNVTNTVTDSSKVHFNNAGLLFGTAVNATATSAFSDKGIALSDYNFTLLSSTINNLGGKTVQLSALSMFASLPYATPQYALWMNQTGVNTNVVTPTLTITFSQNWQRTTGISLYSDVGLFTFILIALGGFIAYVANPEHYDREETRAGKWYRQKNPESLGRIYGAVILVLAITVLIGVIGMVSPLLGGWGGALAFLFVFGVSIWTYTSLPKRQKYSDALLLGTAGGVGGLFVNLYMPFATITYNMAISPDTIAIIAAGATVLLTLAITVMGLMDTTRYNLREKYVKRYSVRRESSRPSRR